MPLIYAARLETASEHPLSSAIVEGAKERDITLNEVEDFEAVEDKGVIGKIQNATVLVGNTKLMDENGIDYSGTIKDLEALEDEVKTSMLIAVGNKIVGIIPVADKIPLRKILH